MGAASIASGGALAEDPPKSEDSMRGGAPSIMAFAGLGLLNALCLGLGLFLGWLVDGELGTLPLFLFLGLAAGIACGVLATRSELKRYR
jgi:F0F1-type ATP synthase assembly protein I